jgi:hypothetical protein
MGRQEIMLHVVVILVADTVMRGEIKALRYKRKGVSRRFFKVCKSYCWYSL